MRAAIQSQQGQAASGKAEEEPILVCIGDDGNAAGRRLGAGPRRQRSAGHALTLLETDDAGILRTEDVQADRRGPAWT